MPGSALALPIHPEGSSRLLQRMRNEAHRTALAFHRKTRSNQLSSSLTQVPGIGEATRTKLFRLFLSAIKAARFEDGHISDINIASALKEIRRALGG